MHVVNPLASLEPLDTLISLNLDRQACFFLCYRQRDLRRYHPFNTTLVS